MPSASYSHTASVDAAPEVVWARLQEADAWAQIGPINRVWDATHRDDGALASFRWSTHAAGRDWSGIATTIESEAPETMVVDLDTSEVKGAIAVRLGDGSIRVDMTLRSVGLLATMFFGVVSNAVGGGLAGHVDEFASRF